VTRSGDLLDFGQLFEAFVTNSFAQISHILSNFCKGVKIFNFLVKSILGNFYRNLVIFSGHTAALPIEDSHRLQMKGQIKANLLFGKQCNNGSR